MTETKTEIKIISKADLIDIDELIPYHLNMNDHPEEQIDLLVSGFIKYGFVGEIEIDVDNIIVNGHGCYLAAKKAGMKKIPYTRLDHLSKSETSGFRIFDNQVAKKAVVNQEKLSIELLTLRDEGFDLKLTGMDEDEVRLWIDEDDEIDLSEGEDEPVKTQSVNQSHTQEIDPDEYEFEHKCPKCGFEWND